MTHEEAVSTRYATFDAFAIWFRLWCGREPTAREVWLYLATRTSEAPAPTTQQRAEPRTFMEKWSAAIKSLPMSDQQAAQQRAEPAADEWAEFETALKQYAEACHRSESCSAMDAARARVCAIFSRAAQSGQRAGVAEYLQQIARAIEEDHPEQAYNLRLFIAGAAPTQQHSTDRS